MQLTTHFSLEEFTRSKTANDNGIKNVPPDNTIPAVRFLCESVLEPAREHFGKPMRISSGYRTPVLNSAVGGDDHSHHMWTTFRAAADVSIAGVDTLTLARWIEANCDVDELICEHYKPDVLNSGWVHVSVRNDGNNHNESLRIDAAGEKALPL
jgi:zinc D-Ala-D-Ala carboxypeptidase